jgi:hypothetical protein
MRTYFGPIVSLKENQIFVFGSNTQGRHGKGAALWAVKMAGAKYGNPQGPQGRSYAIITKDLTKPVHPSVGKATIIHQIIQLYDYVKLPENSNKDFLVAYSTKSNLNGYSPDEMALMFIEAGKNTPIPVNIVFEEQFARLITIILSNRTP